MEKHIDPKYLEIEKGIEDILGDEWLGCDDGIIALVPTLAEFVASCAEKETAELRDAIKEAFAELPEPDIRNSTEWKNGAYETKHRLEKLFRRALKENPK